MDDIFGDKKETNDEIDYDQLYKVIGCDSKATTEQIVAEYRYKARQLHPDKCTIKMEKKEDMEKEFCLLQYAKEILTDPMKRQDYDKWRNSGLKLSYKKWLQIGANKMHCSMHWAGVDNKRPPALTDSLGHNKQDNCSLKDKHLDVNQNSVQFRRHSEVNTNQSLLKRFRNYEI